MESYNIEKMKVPQLRERLLELGLESKGLKNELIARINAHYDNLRTIRLSKNKYNIESDNSEDEATEEIDEDTGDDDDEENESESEENFEIISGPTMNNSTVQNVVKIKKNRGKNLVFNHIAKHENANNALEYITNEKCWIKGTKRETSEGTKQNYLCTNHKSANCPAKCFLLYHCDSDCVSIFKAEHEHNEHVKLSTFGISQQFKSAIDSICDIFQKPAQIKRELIKRFADTNKDLFPTDSQIKNYILYKKKRAISLD